MNLKTFLTLLAALLLLGACNQGGDAAKTADTAAASVEEKPLFTAQMENMYAEFTLTADISHLDDNQKKMLGILIEISEIMDDIFWQQAYGDKEALLASIKDPAQREFAVINYGPWDRMSADAPFIAGVGAKPAGAQYYPADVKKEEIENSDNAELKSQYTIVRRKDDGSLTAIPYREAYKPQVEKAAAKLKEAAALAKDPGFKKYLELRAEALLTDDYLASDMAWMDMKSNDIDFVVGPIEHYEDALFNYKTAHEAYILIKDKAWSKRLEKYAALLPELQKGLPVEDKYKQEKPGSDSDLNAYDVVYYAGDCNAGGKTIAINLPNDERVQLEKGTRRLQLKNAMRAKFDKILEPIAGKLITPEQRKHVTFDAFFGTTMFHEVAHGLGIKNTINDKGLVRRALKERSSAIEEGKADILGLYMISSMIEMGELEGDINDYYVTFIAGIFRSVRFGASSAHGQANMLRFNFFQKAGAFERLEDGTYRVNFDKMQTAMAQLTQKILVLQGNGDYEGVGQWLKEEGGVSEQLQKDLDSLAAANIPTDIVFKQGAKELGL